MRSRTHSAAAGGGHDHDRRHHEVGFAGEVADQLVFSVGGVVVLASALRDVLSNPQQPRTQAVFGKYSLSLRLDLAE